MDGLMFDTENLSNRAWKMSEPSIGMPVEDSMLCRMKGRNPGDCARIMKEYWGENANLPQIRSIYAGFREKIIREEGIPVKPGLYDLLTVLKDHQIRIGLATSTPCEKAQQMLKQTGVLSYFNEIVYGNEVEHGKPQPDIYLECAKRLQALPEECIVLEDAYSGIEAGFRAGCRVIMIPDTLPPRDIEKERTIAILHSLEDVSKMPWVSECIMK